MYIMLCVAYYVMHVTVVAYYVFLFPQPTPGPAGPAAQAAQGQQHRRPCPATSTERMDLAETSLERREGWAGGWTRP